MVSMLTVYDVFSEQCKKNSKAIAIIHKNISYTYGELALRVDQICSKILSSDCGTNVVAIMPRRNLDLFASIFAVIKAGKAYIPIDVNLPRERKKQMFTCCDCMVLADRGGCGDLEGTKVIYFDEIGAGGCLSDLAEENDQKRFYNEIAYIIFTSGSTGIPKGVVVKNESLINLLEGISERIDFSQGKRMTNFTTVSFDMFVVEGIVPLCQGMTLIVADEEEQTNPRLMAKLIADNDLDIVQITSSRMRLLINCDEELSCFQKVKNIMIGAEAVPLNVLKTLQTKTKAKIYNMYGPTETTVWSSISDLTCKDKVDIGTPILNTEFYIVDENMNRAPNGEAGEICISGLGVAAGYWGRDDLTAERFVTLPALGDTRVYKTGDLGRRLEDGTFECLGRMDNQIKLRGYRIELEEIESAINAYYGIHQSLVSVARDDNGEEKLMAFYTAESDIDLADLNGHLKKSLPGYMVPSRYYRIKEFLHTHNGKLDRKKDYLGAVIPMEGNFKVRDSDISPVGRQVIDIIKKEIDMNFFGDVGLDTEIQNLGFDSFSFIKIIFSLEKLFSFEFDGDRIMIHIFKTVRDLVDYVESKKTITYDLN